MTQLRTKKNKVAKLVKQIDELVPGSFINLLEKFVQIVIEAEYDMELGAESYERSESRTNYRNGYRRRKKPLNTAIGPMDISIPKPRKGSFYPSILERYQRVDRALITIISEAYFAGVSTRKMNQLFEELGVAGIDRSLVSRCAAQIDKEVEIWKNRDLDQHYVYIWLDALYVKVRTEQGVVSRAVLVAIGLRKDGYRDVLGLYLGNKESYYNWKDFLQSLNRTLP
jgi:transposase-like protein